MLDIPFVLEEIDRFTLLQTEESYHVHIPARGGPRKYLGLSALGEDCVAKTWFSFRQVAEKQPPARMIRLWNRGHKEEYSFNHLLRGIGFTVHEVDSEGRQFKVDDFDGHVSGHFDGVGTAPDNYWVKDSTPHPFLLEYKTYKASRFNDLVKGGVAKSDIKYHIQMQTYMGYEKLKGALFMAVCKDDDQFHFEWVPFKKKVFEAAVNRAEEILTAQSRPDRISNNAAWWMCKNKTCTCDFYEICHKGAPALKSCRSCKFAIPDVGASWSCLKGKVYGEVCNLYRDITK